MKNFERDAYIRTFHFHCVHVMNRMVLIAMRRDPKLTIKKLRKRLGWSKSKLDHALLGLRELSLRDLGEFAHVCNCELEVSVEPLEPVKDAVISHPTSDD